MPKKGLGFEEEEENNCLCFPFICAEIGDLNVLIKDENLVATQIWSLSGDQGNVWLYAQATLPSNVEYQVSNYGYCNYFTVFSQ